MIEDLVLLHGFGGTRRAWDGVIGALSHERYRPLALDLPGHGTNAVAERPITFAACVRNVLAESPERFALGGYSLGGRIALCTALTAPERVSRLMLVSSTAGIEDAAERAERSARDRQLAGALEREGVEDFLVRWRAQPLFAEDPPFVDELACADYRRNPAYALAAVLRGIGTGEMEPLWERLPGLTMPVTVLAGERDRKFVELGRRMAELLPDAELVIVPGGHRLPLESPEAVARAF
ncbi:MAG TPA: alpha/beta fold hydrolase [Solirubrobacteraceae bacterium]|nr:alpha/beta fold hydrolase [Solirubrobacteraceae bacterium]